MKPLVLIITLLLSSFLISCNKENEDPPLLVQTLFLGDAGDEELKATGRVSVKSGLSEMGFCYSNTNPLPDKTHSFIPFGIDQELFSKNISGLTPGDTIFLRAYATRDGIDYFGETLKAAVKANANPQVPCSLAANTIVANNKIFKVSFTEKKFIPANMYKYCFTARDTDKEAPRLEFDFCEIPKPGIYNVNSSTAVNNKTVRIIYSNYWSTYPFVKDQVLYVSRLADGKLQFDICDSEFFDTGSQQRYPIKASFVRTH